MLLLGYDIIRAPRAAPPAVTRVVVAEPATMRITRVIAVEAVFRFFRICHQLLLHQETVQFTCAGTE